MSPFVVSGDDEQGYRSQRTLVGSRTAEDLINLPVSVGLINLEQLTDFAAISVHQVLRYNVSGVTQNQSFNDDVNIRGFRAGAPLRNGTVTATNKSTPLYDIERVEVLKGPAAMLNGSNGGIGGSINYVSRRPSATPKGEAQFSLTDAGAARGVVNVSGPVKKSQDFSLGYRVTLGALYSDAPRGKAIEWEDQKFYGGALAMNYGQHSSLLVNAYYFVNNDYLYLEDFLDISEPINATTNLRKGKLNKYSTPSYSSVRKQDVFWPLKSTAIDATLLTRLTENTNVRAAYFYGNSDGRRRNARGITVAADNYTLNRQDIRNNNGQTTHSLQVDLLHKLTFKLATIDTTVGVDGATTQSFQNQSIAFMPAADTRTGVPPNDSAWFAQFPNDDAYFITPRPRTIGLPATRTRTKITQASYYFQENVSFWKDRVILIGGLRWFKPGGTDENLVTNTVTNRPNKGIRTHKYGIVFKLLPTVSVYYTDAQNLFPAAAGFTDRVIQDDKLGEPFRDSEGKLKEFGLKFEHRYSDRLSFYGTAAYFKMEQTNIRTFGPLPSGNQGLIQSSKDSAAGWETDLGAQIKTGGGRMDLILTYFNGDSAVADDAGKSYVRQTNAFVPRKFSIFGKYTVISGSLKGLRFGVGLTTEDDKRYGVTMLERPLLADAFIGYALNNRWDLQLNLENLTDERYIVQVAATGLVQGSDTFRPKLTVKYKW